MTPARRARKPIHRRSPAGKVTGIVLPRSPDAVPARPSVEHEGLVPVVGIGASAGGVEAVSELLAHLPSDTGMAFVLVQHLDPEHESLLPEVLARSTRMPVVQAEHGMPLEPDRVHVIPPNAELSLSGPVLTLAPRRAAPGRPALPIDSFFRALARERSRRAIAVVLSGTASDGTDGLRAIQEHDGITLVQDPRSAKFSGMPQSAIAAGVGGEGAEVRAVASAREGVDAVVAFRPDVILSDIAMPGEDGYSFIAKVRALGGAAGGGAPAIALSALASEDDQRRALAAGFQMHLGKPADIDRLIEAVGALSQRKPPAS